MKIIGLMRVRNEARWITQSVESIKALCDPILILDDHSTDGTAELCEAAGAIVYRSEFNGIDEARDKDLLLAKAAEHSPDWCYMLDGDEILEPGGPDIVRVAAASNSAVSFTFPFVYLWDRLDQVRVDRWYLSASRQSMWKFSPGQSFMQTRFGGNFHCGSVPQTFMMRAKPCPAKIYHLGYLHRADRIRKYLWYNGIDPGNEYEDFYQHMVLGDALEPEEKIELDLLRADQIRKGLTPTPYPPPSNLRAKWSGPLELKTVDSPVVPYA